MVAIGSGMADLDLTTASLLVTRMSFSESRRLNHRAMIHHEQEEADTQLR